MRGIDMIRNAAPGELAGMLYRWIVRCSRDCPALGFCRDGRSCRQAIQAWLMSEVDADEYGG